MGQVLHGSATTTHAGEQMLGGSGYHAGDLEWRVLLGSFLGTGLSAERHRSQAYQAKSSVDEWTGRKDEPHH